MPYVAQWSASTFSSRFLGLACLEQYITYNTPKKHIYAFLNNLILPDFYYAVIFNCMLVCHICQMIPDFNSVCSMSNLLIYYRNREYDPKQNTFVGSYIIDFIVLAFNYKPVVKK